MRRRARTIYFLAHLQQHEDWNVHTTRESKEMTKKSTILILRKSNR